MSERQNHSDISTGGGNYNSTSGGANTNATNMNLNGTNAQFGSNSQVTQNFYGNSNKKIILPSPERPHESFVGKTKELAQLKQYLVTGKTSAIVSAGGLGKTSLAKQIAYDMYTADRYFGAVFHGEIKRNAKPLKILNTWASYVGKSFKAPNSIRQDEIEEELTELAGQLKPRLESKCGNKPVLVVLDDVWEESEKYLEILKKACPLNAAILITTRSIKIAVKYAGNNNQIIELEGLDEEDAVNLLSRITKYENFEDLKKLAQLLGGHPIALSLAARLIKTYQFGRSVAEGFKYYYSKFSSELPQGVSFEEMGLDQTDEYNRNLTAVFASSYEELSSEEQRRFRILGALPFSQSFRSEILSKMWDLDLSATERYLSNAENSKLLAHGLLQYKGEKSSVVSEIAFRVNPLLQNYAKTLLKKHGEEDSIQEKYKNISVNSIEEVPFRWVEPPTCLELEAKPVFTNGEGILDFFSNAITSLQDAHPNLVNNLEDAKEFCQKILESARSELIGKQLVAIHVQVGKIFEDMGQYDEAISTLEQALLLSETTKNWEAEAEIVAELDKAFQQTANIEKLRKLVEQSLTLLPKIKRPVAVTTINFLIGSFYFNIGQQDESIKFIEQCLETLPQVPLSDLSEEKRLLINSMSSFYLCNLDEAFQHLSQLLLLFEATENKIKHAQVLAIIGITYYLKGQYREALPYFEQAIPVLNESGDLFTLSTIFLYKGHIFLEFNELDSALECLETQALPFNRRLGNILFEGLALAFIGIIYIQKGDRPKVFEYMQESDKILRNINHPFVEQLRPILDELRPYFSSKGEQ
jgi:tetratricopeptide (TPR) repeat protein